MKFLLGLRRITRRKVPRDGLCNTPRGRPKAWKALPAVLLRPELHRLRSTAKGKEERKLLESIAVPKIPTMRMFSLLPEGVPRLVGLDREGLNIYDHQYHGQDPDMALSKYRSKEEAAKVILALAAEVAERVGALRGRVKWSDDVEKALEVLRGSLSAASGSF